MNNAINEHPVKSPDTRTVGVVINGLTHPCTLNMLGEVTRQLNNRGALTLLLNVESDNHWQSVLKGAQRSLPDGLIIIGTDHSDALISTLKALSDIPVVCPGSISEASTTWTGADYAAAGAETARLLLSQGFQRFGYLQERESNPASAQKMTGFADALIQQDKTLNKVLTAGGADRELAYQAMLGYLKKTRASERINALFCENDLLAFGAMQAIRDFGQGVHIGVVGFADVDEARASTWHLTSWAPPCDQQIAEALDQLLGGSAIQSDARRKSELQIRHSHLGKEVHETMTKCGCASRH
ncbi:LacI family DNA-binding transcriptional regulator [Erwinia sp. ErVv1]|uniref:LacI family DNA-binding transcriptional regulator n=1 Tax=Erwinia sp. ErVv1 TaxID=1603299 RepID=UPI00082D47F5|nr:substrate-binding domain-containing protein [Erwinia sp. ErVv1]